MRDYRNESPRWVRGEIQDIFGTHLYMVCLQDGTVVTHHSVQIQERFTSQPITEPQLEGDFELEECLGEGRNVEVNRENEDMETRMEENVEENRDREDMELEIEEQDGNPDMEPRMEEQNGRAGCKPQYIQTHQHNQHQHQVLLRGDILIGVVGLLNGLLWLNSRR